MSASMQIQGNLSKFFGEQEDVSANSPTFPTLKLLLVAASVLHATPASAENWVDTGNAQVDLDSLRREGSLVYYRMRPAEIWPASEYRVDCSQIDASEVLIERLLDGAWSEDRLPSNTIGVATARYACSTV
jgi:hypothetical protein